MITWKGAVYVLKRLHTPRWRLLPFCRQSGSSRGKADRPWEPRELKLGKVTSEGMVTMTASQPEGVAAAIQQQAKSNLILNCNYIQVFQCECVCFLKWVSNFSSRDINTTQWHCIHELCLFYFLSLSGCSTHSSFQKTCECISLDKISHETSQHVPLPYVVSMGNRAANLSRPLRLPLSDFLHIPSEQVMIWNVCVCYVLFYKHIGNIFVCLCGGGWVYAYVCASTCVIIVNQ